MLYFFYLFFIAILDTTYFLPYLVCNHEKEFAFVFKILCLSSFFFDLERF